MIRICGMRLCDLPEASVAERMLNAQYLHAWRKQHPDMHMQNAKRASLGGLLLLQSMTDATLCYTSNGRPCFVQPCGDLSITHTKRHVLCAVTDQPSMRIGLDAEILDPCEPLDPVRIAGRWFTEGERKALAADPSQKTFLRIWTQKEAIVKQTGEGLRALRETDTACVPTEQGLFLHSYFEDGAVISLCLSERWPVPSGIRWLTSLSFSDTLN